MSNRPNNYCGIRTNLRVNNVGDQTIERRELNAQAKQEAQLSQRGRAMLRVCQ